jgi:GT2 family glycosyltransferase
VEAKKNKVNVGFAGAVNRAIRESSSPYLVILNPDTIIHGDFFKEALKFMEKNPDVSIIGPKIMDSDGTVQGSARSFPTPLTAIFGRSSFLTRFFPKNPISRQNILTADTDSQNAIPVDWVSGACMIVRRSAIERVGLMDERFFMYWEDADWCRRMADAGFKVMYYPLISMTHHIGKSSKTRFFRSAFDFHWSAFKLYRKYTPVIKFIMMQPILIPGLMIRCMIVILRGSKH